MRDALESCLDVMLRMIPEYCDEATAEPCTDQEHNEAIAKAAVALYGSNRSAWPKNVRKAADGVYS